VSAKLDGNDEWLLDSVRRARAQLPREHRSLLEEIGAREAVIDAWPQGVLDLFVALHEPPPAAVAIADAAAVWVEPQQAVVFNGPLFQAAAPLLQTEALDRIVAHVAWHEYGYAISVTRSTWQQRRAGLRLLGLLPLRLREAIDYPGHYRRDQLFDEVVATVYPVMVERVRHGIYRRPRFLHSDVIRAFEEAIPWPPKH
jgi:hypothetical protein